MINPPRLVARDDQTLARTRFITYLLTGFAAVAAFLAMLGIYGVTAYAVQQRRKEVAIRSRSARPERALVGIFLREGAWLLGARNRCRPARRAAISRILRNRVFGVQPFDASTYLVACALLVGTGLAAAAWARGPPALGHPVAALNGE